MLRNMLRNLRRLCLPGLFFFVALLAACLGGLPVAPAQPKEKLHAEHDAAKGDHDAGKGGHDAGKADHDAGHATEKKTGMMEQLLLHVLDSEDIHLFESMHLHVNLKEQLGTPFFGQPITKFMVLEVLAAFLIVIIYVPLAWQVRDGSPARGWFFNAFEVLLTFVRDQIAKPSIGPDSDRYVPFLWTMFLFILFNNLLGMFPFLGSPTASIFVTGALALLVFFAIHGSAIVEMAYPPAHGHGHDGHGHGHDNHGHGGHTEATAARPSLLTGLVLYVQSFWPNIDLPNFPLGLPIKMLIFVLEIMSTLVRNAVLAVRLFANMFAGHMVLATILLFIQMAANVIPGWLGELLWGTVTVASIVGILALSLLEIFVAFLQAYVFTYLAAIFMGMAMHPEH
jgi:F-type H+-transporting ATPase subunit a